MLLKFFAEATKQVALYHDAERIIHAEILDSTRWLLWQHKQGTDKRVVLKQGKHRHPKQACEQALAAMMGISLDNDHQLTAQASTQAPKRVIDALERDGLSFRQQFRLYGSLMSVCGISVLAWYYWLRLQPSKALSFLATVMVLWLAARQLMRLFKGELGLRDSLKGKQVYHVKH